MRQYRGVVEPVPGLYVLGLDFMYALTSATLPGVTRDAAHLARRMRTRGAGAPATGRSTVASARP